MSDQMSPQLENGGGEYVASLTDPSQKAEDIDPHLAMQGVAMHIVRGPAAGSQPCLWLWVGPKPPTSRDVLG